MKKKNFQFLSLFILHSSPPSSFPPLSLFLPCSVSWKLNLLEPESIHSTRELLALLQKVSPLLLLNKMCLQSFLDLSQKRQFSLRYVMRYSRVKRISNVSWRRGESWKIYSKLTLNYQNVLRHFSDIS